MFKKTLLTLALLTLALGTTACNKDKQAAVDGFAKIQAACEAKKADEAKELGTGLYKGNALFKKTIDAATPDVEDKTKVNYCAPILLSETKMRLENS